MAHAWAPTALIGALAAGEQDRLDVHRPFLNVQDGDAVNTDAVADQIEAMQPATDAVMFATGHNGSGLRLFGNVEAELLEFAHEAQRSRWVVLGNVGAERFKARLGLCRDQDHHSVGRHVHSYLRSRREKTLVKGFTRPASSSSMPRANAWSSTAIRASRSWIRRMPSRRTSLFELYRPLSTSFETKPSK